MAQTLADAVCFRSEALAEILVVVKALGMGFHLPVDGIRSLGLVCDDEEHEEDEEDDIMRRFGLFRQRFRSSMPRT